MVSCLFLFVHIRQVRLLVLLTASRGNSSYCRKNCVLWNLNCNRNIFARFRPAENMALTLPKVLGETLAYLCDFGEFCN